MLAEFVAKIAALAAEGHKPVELPSPDPLTRRLLVGGEVQEVRIAPPPRGHHAHTLDALIAYAEGHAAGSGTPAVAWYDEDEVVLVLDDDGPRASRAVLELEKTTTYILILGLTHARPLGHKEFLRLLRVDLSGALPAGALLDRVRRIDFESGQVTRARVGRADESLGREVTAKVMATDDLPEHVTLSCRVWRGLPYEASVVCAVEVDPHAATLALVPLPDALERAVDLAMASLGDDLSGRLPASIPAYRGRP